MTIEWGKILLIGFLVLFILYIVRGRSELSERIFYILSTLVGIVFVTMPGITTKMANLIGIGRGTDLILYLFMIVSLFFSFSVSSKNRQLNRRMTEIVRFLARNHAETGKGFSERHPSV